MASKFMLFPVFILFFMSNPVSSKAQFGVAAGWAEEEWTTWNHQISQNAGNSEIFYLRGPAVEFNYWFRLKNYRVEFLPALRWHGSNDDGEGKATAQTAGLLFHTQIYLLDMKGDCDCPTWSKKGNLFKKGFFIQLSPGVEFGNWRYQATASDPAVDVKANSIAYSVAGGIGLDIGISDLLTLSPQVGYRHYPGVIWPGLFGEDVKQNTGQKYAAIRLGIRLNGSR
mgnify:CR=1 FL=1